MPDARTSALPDGLPPTVARAASYLTGLGHPVEPAVAMAANLLNESLPHPLNRVQKRHRSLTMTPEERQGLSDALLSRVALLEGAGLALRGEGVREGAVLSAHALCEAASSRRRVRLPIGGAVAAHDQVEAARSRLVAELDTINALLEATDPVTAGSVADEGEDLVQGVGGSQPHPRVTHLQNRLNQLGHRVLPDGKFGPVTAEAVKDFQAKAGMLPSGVVDADTISALRHGRRVVDVPPALAPQSAGPPLTDIGDGNPNKETGNDASQKPVQIPKALPSAKKVEAVLKVVKGLESLQEAAPTAARAQELNRRRAELAVLQEDAAMEEARLSSAERDKLPDSAFVFPKDRSYPIHDESHARNALSRSAGKPEHAKVVAKVKARYPKISVEESEVSEAVRACPTCAAPMRAGGKVCQRGHRLMEARDSSSGDEHRNVKCPKCDTVQSATHKECSKCGHDLSGARKAKFAQMDEAWSDAARMAATAARRLHPQDKNVLDRIKPGSVMQRPELGGSDDQVERMVQQGHLVRARHPAGWGTHLYFKAGDRQAEQTVRRRGWQMNTPLHESAELQESPQTAALSVTHAPIGKGGTNWVTRSKPGNTGQLPAYIQNVRNAIMRDGKSESEATAIAVGRIRDWAEGKGGVSAEVKAAAAKAIAEWEGMRGASHAKSAVKKVGRAVQEAAEERKGDESPDPDDIDPDELEKRLAALKSQGDKADGVQVSRANQQAAMLVATGKVKAGRFDKLREAASVADFPGYLACPSCGARASRDAATCPRGHRLHDARVLMHALARSVAFDDDVALLLRECEELREDWAGFDVKRKGGLAWDAAPGGKRYEFSHSGHHMKVVRQNTAAGGPRWKAYHTNPQGTTRIVGKGDDFKAVRSQAEQHFHGLGVKESELRETWADWDAKRHSWGKAVKAGPMPGQAYKDSPGRGPTGKLRNFDSMSGPKLAATLEALMVHGEDHEAHQAAMLSAGKKLGMSLNLQPPGAKAA